MAVKYPSRSKAPRKSNHLLVTNLIIWMHMKLLIPFPMPYSKLTHPMQQASPLEHLLCTIQFTNHKTRFSRIFGTELKLT